MSLDRPRAVAWLAGALFFLAPQNLDAASWYAASTDLFATAFVLAALVALVRGRPVLSTSLALAAFVSKESALVLPALAYVVLGAGAAPAHRAPRLRAVLPHAALAAVVLGVRAHVLGGWGGAGDAKAPSSRKLVQLASGLVHVGTGAAVLPDALAWGLGGAALALLALRGDAPRRRGAVRWPSRRSRSCRCSAPAGSWAPAISIFPPSVSPGPPPRRSPRARWRRACSSARRSCSSASVATQSAVRGRAVT